jgi:hypothetical protein
MTAAGDAERGEFSGKKSSFVSLLLARMLLLRRGFLNSAKGEQ